MILEKVNSPNDVKKLSYDEMRELSGEIRELIMKKVNAIGGHMGPNLGIVEATIGLHYVFNSPEDKIIFDVSISNPTDTVPPLLTFDIALFKSSVRLTVFCLGANKSSIPFNS